MERLKALQRHWEDHPPAPVLIAAFMGVKPKEKGNPEELLTQLASMPGVKIEKVKANGG